MDTRTKIVAFDAVPGRSRDSKIILGYFDPLYSAHIQALRDACAPGAQIVVAVDHPANPVLPWRARAELLAALSFVDYVVDARECGAPEIDLRNADLARTESLARHIALRNQTA